MEYKKINYKIIKRRWNGAKKKKKKLQMNKSKSLKKVNQGVTMMDHHRASLRNWNFVKLKIFNKLNLMDCILFTFELFLTFCFFFCNKSNCYIFFAGSFFVTGVVLRESKIYKIYDGNDLVYCRMLQLSLEIRLE